MPHSDYGGTLPHPGYDRGESSRPGGKRAYKGVPVVIIEILSPEDRFQDLIEKYRDYTSLGVQHIVQLDPVSRTTFVYKDGSLIAGHVTTLEFEDGRRLDLSTEKLFARFVAGS
jgi:Uma2 family endonuclease